MSPRIRHEKLAYYTTSWIFFFLWAVPDHAYATFISQEKFSAFEQSLFIPPIANLVMKVLLAAPPIGIRNIVASSNLDEASRAFAKRLLKICGLETIVGIVFAIVFLFSPPRRLELPLYIGAWWLIMLLPNLKLVKFERVILGPTLTSILRVLYAAGLSATYPVLFAILVDPLLWR